MNYIEDTAPKIFCFPINSSRPMCRQIVNEYRPIRCIFTADTEMKITKNIWLVSLPNPPSSSRTFFS